MSNKFKLEYLRQIKLDDILISVWHDDEIDFPIDWSGNIIYVKDKNVTDEELIEFFDKDLIETFKRRTEEGYISFTYDSFRQYIRKCIKHYSEILGIQAPRYKIINDKGLFGMCYSSKYIGINISLVCGYPTELCNTIAHELVHTLRGYKQHDDKFYEKLEWLLNEGGDRVPF